MDLIGGADIATDYFGNGTGPWPIEGEQSRHLKYAINGQDSRDYWYDKTYEQAIEALKIGHCAAAAQYFGRALHSRQDKSAHREWPTGEDWHQWVTHPGWWDYYGTAFDNIPNYPDGFWADFSRDFPAYYGDIYDVWRNTPLQRSSQDAAMDKVEDDTKSALKNMESDIGKYKCKCPELWKFE